MRMPRRMLALTLLVTLLLPLSVKGGEFLNISGSTFAFKHPPVNPLEPDGFCLDPLGNPGFLFEVSSDDFGGLLVTQDGVLPFLGEGEAVTCAFQAPIAGVSAQFSGSLTWTTAVGELHAVFEGIDLETDIFGVFESVILIKLTGGTGEFAGAKGFALAQGFDFPFGGLGGDPASAGVVGSLTFGLIKLDD